jgi:hypothetical protein
MRRFLYIVIPIVLAAVIALFVTGCEVYDSNNPALMPSGATNIRNVGNNYTLFDWEVDGRKHTFLYKKIVDGHATRDLLTVVK